MISRVGLWLLICALVPISALSQTGASELRPILETKILPADVALFQLRDYVVRRVKNPPQVSDAAQWTKMAQQIRQHLVQDVVFHGWPTEWVTSPPKFEEVGVLPGKGYRIRKLRYEIVPGFQGVALLYEPEKLSGKVPAIVNVNGHGEPGKALEYKQKRCITFAQHGILALNLEWFYYGDLHQPTNEHTFGAHLDLAGTSGVGLFYLAMRKGVDYLYDHPNVDRERIGVTGLSGGGWQTIVLSSLDERVKASVPVAGFTSTVSRVEDAQYGDPGDFEQNATDLFQEWDYPTLVALRAPRPTLLIYNAEDNCCFRGSLAKPFVFDPIRRFFALYGKENALRWYENRDPGTHNYLLDNRRQAYRFFGEEFGVAGLEESPEIGSEVRSPEELAVGLPENNLTILDLARKLAKEIKREALPAEQTGRDAARKRLKQMIRLDPSPIDRVWTIAITKHHGVESRSHVFAMKSGLSASGVWLKPIEAGENLPATIVLDDQSIAESAARVADRINRGEQVLAVDLTFTGNAWKHEDVASMEQVMEIQGGRPLGIRVGQLLELAKWMRERGSGARLRVEAHGIRSQVTALMAAAIEPGVFSEIAVRDGKPSLGYLYEKPVQFSDAPDLFCLDLYKETDLDRLGALAAPTTVSSASGQE